MKYKQFVEGITQAFQHKGGIKAMHLGKLDPAWFAQLQKDCAEIIASAGSSDVAMKGHVTNWTRPSGTVRQFSLFNVSGESADTKGDYGYLGDASKKRLVFPEKKTLARYAALFQPNLRNLRLNGMGVNSSLNAHEENSITMGRFGVGHIVRFHIPIFSNPSARVYLDDERIRFEEGHVYFFNHGCVHAASNDGPEPRYHIVLDAFLDSTLYERLFPGFASIDPGFVKAAAQLQSEPYHFPNFSREDGKIIHGRIDYGRHVPRPLDWYRRRYPSVFGNLPEPKLNLG